MHRSHDELLAVKKTTCKFDKWRIFWRYQSLNFLCMVHGILRSIVLFKQSNRAYLLSNESNISKNKIEHFLVWHASFRETLLFSFAASRAFLFTRQCIKYMYDFSWLLYGVMPPEIHSRKDDVKENAQYTFRYGTL